MWNMKLWSEEEQDERMRKAKLMFNFALELCLLQSRNGSGFCAGKPSSCFELAAATSSTRVG